MVGVARPVVVDRSARAVWRTLGLDEVRLEGGFWAGRQAVNREAALPHGLRMLEEAGNLDNLRIVAGRSDRTYRGPYYMDSDVYKWLEAAAFELGRAPSAALRELIEPVVELVGAAQQPDGYLGTYYLLAVPGERWTDFAHGHELYNAGHLFQAAVALRRASDDGRLLEVACRFADHIDSQFGPGKRTVVPGHPEVEMALVELYRETGERRYLELAQFFVDQRGQGLLGPGRFNSSAYFQDGVPVREASQLEGHAVRAQYLASGVADLYLETGEAALFASLTRQWDDLVRHKLYLTGAVGARHHAESVGLPYELPNDLAYGETCGAIASMMWSWRMLLATGQGKYADLIEQTLYNAFLSGVSLDGERYFYCNPLASRGDEERLSRGGNRRRPWHGVACCPPNVMRLLASLGHYFATASPTGLQLHQYGSAGISTTLSSGRELQLAVATDYPWNGLVSVTFEQTPAEPWTLSLRLPAWATGASVHLNGATIEFSPNGTGYLDLQRTWRPGDRLELDLALAPRLIEAHPWIESTRGCVAIQRGPLVYCLEQPGQADTPLFDLEIDANQPLTAAWRDDLLGGVTTVQGTGSQVDRSGWQDQLYRPFVAAAELSRRPVALEAIPYFAWANREPSAMRVWIPRT
jgi:uncharacterized protein